MPNKYLPVKLKRAIRNRAKGRCEYCLSLAKYSAQPYVFEHIVPLAKGGQTDSENLAYACGGCNNYKYTKTEAQDPINGAMVPLYNPRRDKWTEHFSWDEEFVEILGLTPSGRATVVCLRLNRTELVHLRRITKLTDEHPPDFLN